MAEEIVISPLYHCDPAGHLVDLFDAVAMVDAQREAEGDGKVEVVFPAQDYCPMHVGVAVWALLLIEGAAGVPMEEVAAKAELEGLPEFVNWLRNSVLISPTAKDIAKMLVEETAVELSEKVFMWTLLCSDYVTEHGIEILKNLEGKVAELDAEAEPE